MTVKELIQLLKGLDKEAVVDLASDEEGNSFGDIDYTFAETRLKKNNKKVYSLYPMNNEMPEERYID